MPGDDRLWELVYQGFKRNFILNYKVKHKSNSAQKTKRASKRGGMYQQSIPTQPGVLIEVDEAIKEYIIYRSNQVGRPVVKAVLDSTHLLVDPKELNFVMEEVESLHEKNTFAEDPDES